jgi:hypothetical protein
VPSSGLNAALHSSPQLCLAVLLLWPVVAWELRVLLSRAAIGRHWPPALSNSQQRVRAKSGPGGPQWNWLQRPCLFRFAVTLDLSDWHEDHFRSLQASSRRNA